MFYTITRHSATTSMLHPRLATSTYSAVYIYNFLHVFFGGEGGEEGATKLSQNLLKVSPKVSPKFWQNFMSSKFQKNHNTSYQCITLITEGSSRVKSTQSQNIILSDLVKHLNFKCIKQFFLEIHFFAESICFSKTGRVRSVPVQQKKSVSYRFFRNYSKNGNRLSVYEYRFLITDFQ